MIIRPVAKIIFLSTAALALAACGSDDSSSTTNTAQFSLGVSDAPVDSADAVVACFNAVEFSGNGEGTQTFTIGADNNVLEANDVCTDADGNVIENTHGINLLDYTGSDSENVLNGITLAAGTYGQVRLVMAEGSYVMVGDTKIALEVPSNELKLGSLTLDAGSQTSYTAEFDLRKGLVNPVGQDNYFLKPNAVRFVDNLEVGHVEGTVAEALLINNECTVAPEDTSVPVGSVYLYSGSDLESTTLADVGGSETNSPYTATAIYFDGVDTYNFEVGYVAAGEYTAAWTCTTTDDPDADDAITFIDTQNITVNSGEEVTTVTFE